MQRSKREHWFRKGLRTIQALSLAGLCCSVAWAAPVEIVDLRGKTVRLEQPAQRIVLSGTDDYGVLAMLDPHPARRVVAWNKWRLDEETLGVLRAQDPEAFDRMAYLSIDGPQNLHAEALIALSPDLVVVNRHYGSAAQTLSRLERAGIAVALLELAPDLRDENPTAGLEKLAVLVGREAEGKKVSAFMRERLDRIQRGVADLKAKGVKPPRVLMEPHAGSGPCCLSMGAGKSLGDLVIMAGGELIGRELIPGMAGQLNAEYVIAQDPEVYIGTGGGHLKARGGLLLGPGISASQARDSLRQAVQRKGLRQSSAVQQQRVYGVWHSGQSLFLLEKIATWLHPEAFRDVDPDATLKTIQGDFMKLDMPGQLWIDLSTERR